jgi:hypothetical protein
MKIHLIYEGSTDYHVLKKILDILLQDDIEFIEPSNTQRKNRGVCSITNPKKLRQFLHHSFQKRAEFIIICIDNDNGDFDDKGVPKRENEMEQIYEAFYKKHSEKYFHQPKHCIVVPVQTIDYWMLAGLQKNSGVGTLKGIEEYNKSNIKHLVYGNDNLNPIGAPYRDTFSKILKEAINNHTVNNMLIYLPSFARFYDKVNELCGSQS